MDILINGLRAAYSFSGSGPTVLLLHGWDTDSTSLEPLRRRLSGHCHAISVDMPGCGESEPPSADWGLDEYAVWLLSFIDEVCPEQPLIVAQDWSGRIALTLAATRGLSRLLLINTACSPLLEDNRLRRRVFAYNFRRRLTRLPMTAAARSRLLRSYPQWDTAVVYSRSLGQKRQIWERCMAVDLRPLLPDIMAETLLVYGDGDEGRAFEQAELLQQGLSNSGLAILDGCGHWPQQEQFSRLAALTDYYIRSHRCES